MQNTKIRLLAGGLLLLTGSYAQAETLQPDPAWQRGKLPNGFQWQILATPQRPSDRTEVRLLVNAGSLAESTQQNGFSHFLSRLILNQASHQSESLWQQGVDPQRPAPPAIVSYDNALFSLSLPNNRGDLLKTALHSLATNIGELEVTPETVNATLGTQDLVGIWPDTQDSWWRYRLKGSALLGHDPASQITHPIDTEKLKDFYEKWYTPDAMTLVVVGNVDSRNLVDQINKTFGELKGKRKTPVQLPTMAALSHDPVSLMSHHVHQNRLSLTWDTPWQPILESGALMNYWRADLAREALFWNVRQHLEKKNLKDINLSFDCRVIYQLAECAINMESPTDKLAENLTQVGRELLVVRDHGLSQDEFNTLIVQKKNELSQLFATYARMDTGVLMGQRMRSQQNQVVDISPENYQKLRQEFLDNLTVAVLNQDLRQQLSHDMSLILLQPQGEPEYNMKELQAVWNKVVNPAGDETPKQEEPETVSP